ncbi:hypothetical protein BH20ACT5_BH20ACT5_16370 [soil metagenome]
MSGTDAQDSSTEVHPNSGFEPEEMERLRARIDEVQADALEQQGPEGVVADTCKAFDLTRELVEQGILSTRHRGRDMADQAQLRSIVEANVAFLQAAVNARHGRTPE